MSAFTRLLKNNGNYRSTWTGQIVSDVGDGVVRVQMTSGGGVLQAQNPTGLPVNARVYVKGDAITGEAPDLPVVRIEI